MSRSSFMGYQRRPKHSYVRSSAAVGSSSSEAAAAATAAAAANGNTKLSVTSSSSSKSRWMISPSVVIFLLAGLVWHLMAGRHYVSFSFISYFWKPQQQHHVDHTGNHNTAEASIITTTTSTLSSSLLLSSATSQHAPCRNNSRALCGKIPNSSPNGKNDDVRLPHRRPIILSSSTSSTARRISDNGNNRKKHKNCRPNAILYVVQKGQHSSYYGRNSTALFLKSLDLLYKNYLSIDRRHSENVDVLLFHTGDYTKQDLDFLDARYHYTVHFKLIDLNHTNYWSIPDAVRHDNVSQWGAYPEFSIGYRHMMRWYALKLYDFVRDYCGNHDDDDDDDDDQGGKRKRKRNNTICPRYRYLMRMDEDSFLHSPISYDLFDFMQSHNYSYAFRMCSYEMKTSVWEDYMDHVEYCNRNNNNNHNNNNNNHHPNHVMKSGSSSSSSSQPKIVTIRPHRHIESELCGFYNNFFIIDVDFVLQPDVQHFLQWTDAVGIMYRDRYNDLQIQTMAVYAFLPPQRIHRFLDWTYEHMTYEHHQSSSSSSSSSCPIWGAIQAGYLDQDIDQHLRQFELESKWKENKCQGVRLNEVFTEKDMSPTYAHLPPSSWWKDTLGIPRNEFQWKTIAMQAVEVANQGIMSG